MTVNSIGTCLLMARLYRIAKEELAKGYGTKWLNKRQKMSNYSSFQSSLNHTDIKMNNLLAKKKEKLMRRKKKRRKTMIMTMKKKKMMMKKKNMMMAKEDVVKPLLSPQKIKQNKSSIGHFLKTVSVWLGLTKNSTAMKNYNNPIIKRYVYQMKRFKNIFPTYKSSDIKILLFDKWNASIRCDKLFIRMVILGGVLRLYEPETGIIMQKVSCHNKDFVKTFDTITKTWINGCFQPFSQIEKKFKKRLDVTEITLPLTEVRQKDVVGIIEYLTGRQTSETKILSIWAKSIEKNNNNNNTANIFTISPPNVASCNWY
uniref:Wsv134-like protein n=1 Tax=Metapenaeus joyneri majanivirus TaxID=2984280 RepID=A0A9C7EYR5_9VIRU|nr:MAG: wsv134-like protein [Metapenaeus joyneri majanivirus]